MLDTKNLEKSREAAFYIGCEVDKYLEIHEASDGSWGFTLYGPDFSEIDGGQIGDPEEPCSLLDAVQEIEELFEMEISLTDFTMLNPYALEAVTDSYNPSKPKEHMHFLGKVLQRGFDPSAFPVEGHSPVDLTELDLSDEMVKDEINYQMLIQTVRREDFTEEQWQELEKGSKAGVDVALYAKPEFSFEQMRALRNALRAEDHGFITHEDVLSVADPAIPAKEMRLKYRALWKKHEEEEMEMLSHPDPTATGTYRYYSTQRPVGPGTYPKPADNAVAEILNFDDRQAVEEGKLQAWGYVEYEKPLSAEDMHNYELSCIPAKK